MAKKKSSRRSVAEPVDAYKPSIEVDASKLRGKTLTVGKSANLNIRGRVIEERIDTYSGGKKSYRVEVNKISSPTKRRK